MCQIAPLPTLILLLAIKPITVVRSINFSDHALKKSLRPQLPTNQQAGRQVLRKISIKRKNQVRRFISKEVYAIALLRCIASNIAFF